MSAEVAFRSYAIRIRPRDGFGWGTPSLAVEGLFAWIAPERVRDASFYPSPPALFPSHREAERLAAKVRSRRLSARPVPVSARLMWSGK